MNSPNPFSRTLSPALRRCNLGFIVAGLAYVLAFFGIRAFVGDHPQHGPAAYALAGLQSLPILAMFGVLLEYLRSETDEYLRLLAVRSVVIAGFAVLAMGAYTDSLRSLGHFSAFPPMTEFVTFWSVQGIAQCLQTAWSSRAHE